LSLQLPSHPCLSSEEEVVLPHSKKKSPGEVNGYSLEDVVASKPPHIPLQRIISIEEDHLPQLLQDDYHAQLCEWSEEAEEDGEEEEHIELQMNSIYPPSSLPTREQQPADTRESETPTSPRGQPVGKETVVNVRLLCSETSLIGHNVDRLCFVSDQ
jgi:hypothetical protein